MKTVSQLTYILYKNDPMGTQCTANRGMEDEYENEAKEIHIMLLKGIPFKQAYYRVMVRSFYEEYVLDRSSSFFKIELEYYNHKV